MKKDKTITHDELRAKYDLRNLQVRKVGYVRKVSYERRRFGKFAKRVTEPDSKCKFKKNLYLFELRKVA